MRRSDADSSAGRPRRGQASAARRARPATDRSGSRPPTVALRQEAARPAAVEPRRRTRGSEQPTRRDDLIYGRNAVLEAARAGRVRRVLLAEGLDADPRLEALRRLVTVEVVPATRVDALAHGAHQGVVGELAPRSFMTLRDLLRTAPTLLLGLDGIEDPQNLGAILRTAEAAGVDGVLLPERRSAPLSGAAVKASSGASELLRLCRVSGLASAVAEVRRAGLWCVALEPRGEVHPWDLDLTQPTLLVVGGEGHGVHRLVRERCDARMRLPMSGRLASLNASAAAAAMLYEVVRQRLRSSAD